MSVQPGRSCPLHYRYALEDFERRPAIAADTLYVVGGLYGNGPALDAVLDMAAAEPRPVVLAFNGDFNWFDADAQGFRRINDTVLSHVALRGNVETELAAEAGEFGCGCAYPEWVSDAEVERSNAIMARLRETACCHPELRRALGQLPMHAVAAVGGIRVALVHGDATSLAGWSYAQERLTDRGHRDAVAQHFGRAGVRVIASSHTCLPVAADFDTPHGRCILINNGAAGMPNFRGTRHGIITRIGVEPAGVTAPLYGTRLDTIHVEALPVHYDHEAWMASFLSCWPRGTPGYESYHRRLVSGPGSALEAAVRWSTAAPPVI